MATIVLLDGDNDARKLAELTLQQDGHEVFGYADGRRLLAAADSLPRPALIVRDGQMPLPKAPAAWKDVPTLILIGPDGAMPDDAADTLGKPYALAALRRHVAALLRG